MTSTIQTNSSGTTYLTGTVSKLNTQQLIDNAVALRLRKRTRLTDQINNNTNKIVAYQDLQSLSKTVQDKLNVLKSFTTGTATNVLTSKQVSYTSSDSTVPTNVLTATAGTTAQTGTRRVVVSQIAQALSVTSDEQVSATAALGFTGTFDIAEAGKTAATINVTATTTLQDIANAINATTTTSGVKADILQSTNGNYKLVITGNDTATNINITNITGTNVLNSLDVIDGLGAFSNVSQAAQQAQISIDGTTIFSNTNKITNALTGVDLDLKSAAPATTITLTIGDNVDGTKKAIEEFVTAYNALRNSLASYQKISNDGTIAASAYLYNDALTTGFARNIASAVTGTYGSGSVYNSLAAVGVTIDSKNELKLDAVTLDKALKNNFSDVKSLFATDGVTTGVADTLYTQLDNYAKPSNGSFALSVVNLETLDNELVAKADAIQTAADVYRQSLIDKYAKLETQLARANTVKKQLTAILNGNNKNNN